MLCLSGPVPCMYPLSPRNIQGAFGFHVDYACCGGAGGDRGRIDRTTVRFLFLFPPSRFDD